MALAAPSNLTATAVSSLLAAPSITTTALPSATVGQVYAATLTATGGLAPYTWRLNAGLLPTGLSLSSSGLISGTPMASGLFTFAVLATDALNQIAALSLVMEH